VTSLAQELGAGSPTDARILDALAEGFATRLDLDLVSASDLPVPEDIADDLASGWALDPRLDRCNELASMLGTLRVHLQLDPTGRIALLRLVGDVIAPPATMTAIEAALVGAALDEVEVEARLTTVLASGEHWLLGAGPVSTLARAIARGTA
jgi:hypothetical protein